jgi:hypothetical protein
MPESQRTTQSGEPPKRWFDQLLVVDRRWIYLLMAVAVCLPAVLPFSVPVGVTREVRSVYDYVESLKPGDTILLAIDYDPSTLAELQPMTEVIMTQAFRRGARCIVTALSQFGPAMAEGIIDGVAAQAGKKRNIDYTFLGYKPYPGIVILAMGTDFRVPFPTDYYGTRLDDIPMMRDLHNYRDVKAVISLCAGSVADMWITYANAKYGVPVALGLTGVMGSDYYPYLQSGQVFGLIPGIKGAAEYEQLAGVRGSGSRGMPYQVVTHVVILTFMVITNIGYIAQRRARRRAATQSR